MPKQPTFTKRDNSEFSNIKFVRARPDQPMFAVSALAHRGEQYEHAALLVPGDDQDQALGIAYALVSSRRPEREGWKYSIAITRVDLS
jgi:hypothetical protein